MEMKRKIKATNAATTTATATFLCYCCSRHLLITFVGMTVLIVSYGVNTVQMSAEPLRNGNGSNISVDNKNTIIRKIVWKKNFEYIAKRKSKSNQNWGNINPPKTPTFHASKENDGFQLRSSSRPSDFDVISEHLRKARFFGLLGSNFSLSYNLTSSSGTSAANVTVVAPTPTYYYYPAPSYPYYDPYSYYNPYASAPYPYYTYDPYNPYAGYNYYG